MPGHWEKVQVSVDLCTSPGDPSALECARRGVLTHVVPRWCVFDCYYTQEPHCPPVQYSADTVPGSVKDAVCDWLGLGRSSMVTVGDTCKVSEPWANASVRQGAARGVRKC